MIRRFQYIAGWHKKGLTCARCAETRSVKYEVEGEAYCNACVGKVTHWDADTKSWESGSVEDKKCEE